MEKCVQNPFAKVRTFYHTLGLIRTAAEVVTSLGRFASKYGEDAGIAVELSWAGPLCVQRETVQDSEEEAEDAAAAELSRTVSCGGG